MNRWFVINETPCIKGEFKLYDLYYCVYIDYIVGTYHHGHGVVNHDLLPPLSYFRTHENPTQFHYTYITILER